MSYIKCHILRLNAPNSILAGALDLERPECSPIPLAGFKGSYFYSKPRDGAGSGGKGREKRGR